MPHQPDPRRPAWSPTALARLALLGVGGFLIANAAWLAATANLNLGMLAAALAGGILTAWGIWFDRVRRHRVLLAALAAGTGLILGLAAFLASYGVRDNVTHREDALIVLGAAVHGRDLSHTLADRLDAALAYRRDNPGVLLVVSGGQGPQEDVTEASAMREYLLAHGVPDAAILVEDRSTSTEENFANSKALLDARLPAGYTVAFATNEFHVYRAERIARARGLAPTHVHSDTPWYYWATSYLREELAVVASWAGAA